MHDGMELPTRHAGWTPISGCRPHILQCTARPQCIGLRPQLARRPKVRECCRASLVDKSKSMGAGAMPA